MSSAADLLNVLPIDNYAALAFSLDPKSPTGFGAGGIYAGPLVDTPGAKPWWDQYACPGNSRIHARARLVSIAPGKIFVRWANTDCATKWEAAAAGPWWFSDNMANLIVKRTIDLGPTADTSGVARQWAQVDPNWSNDMRTVVVCRTTRPIKVLLGVGRPVPGVPVVSPGLVDAPQVIILTTLHSPKNAVLPANAQRRRFIGKDFMQPLWCGNSYAFIAWWQKANFVKGRREAKAG